MPVALRLYLLTALLAGSAQAGPWPRAEGDTFFSLEFETREDEPATRNSAYAEYGLGSELTIGLDAHDDGADSWTAFAFLRAPLTEKSTGNLFSLTAGIGAEGTGEEHNPLFVFGGSWGLGLGQSAGWISVDAQARYNAGSEETEYRTDATLGLRAFEHVSLVQELNVSGTSVDDRFARFRSSIIGEIAPGASVEIGASVPLTEDENPGFHIGTWLEF